MAPHSSFPLSWIVRHHHGIGALVLCMILVAPSAWAGDNDESDQPEAMAESNSQDPVKGNDPTAYGLPEYYDEVLPDDLKLIAAAETGWAEKVRELLDQGMSVETVYPPRTVLNAAIGGATPWGDGGYPEVVEMLLARGADPNRQLDEDDPVGNPLYRALHRYALAPDSAKEEIQRRKKVIEILLDFGGRLTRTWVSTHYEHPLLYAGERCDRDLIERFLNSDFDLTKPDSDSIPLFACRDTEIVRLLLDHGAEITPGFVKWTLGGVNKSWKAEIAHWLLDAGVDPREYRFVRFALAWKDYDLLKRSLDGGASPDKFLKPSINIPLVYSALGNDLQAVEILLEYGADTGAKWREKTASDWAREDGYDEIARLIEQRTSNAASE